MSGGVEMARSTFNRHKDAIEDMFGIFIDCDRRDGNRYYIGNEYVLRDDSVQNWMLSTLSVNNIISESLSLQDRTLLESIPSDGEMLHRTIDAMKSRSRIEVEYRRYGSDSSRTFIMDPYCIKLWKQRWYLLGHFPNETDDGSSELEHCAIFSFDRMVAVRKVDERFDMHPDFSAEDYFRDFYGVLADTRVEVQDVVLRAFGKQKYYLRDLPLHSSQKETDSGEGYTDFRYRLRPTFDFTTKLVSYGAFIKVLEPQWLADEVRDIHRRAAEMYVTASSCV